MIRCSECKTVDVEFSLKSDNEERYYECPECGATDCEEEIDALDWAEEMTDEEVDNLMDYLAREGDNEES